MKNAATPAPVSPESLLKVGHLSTPYGIKGWVWVFALTEPLSNVFEYRPWYLRRAHGYEPVEVLEWREQGKGIVARLKGCDDRNAAELLRNVEVWVPKDSLPELDEDEFYWSDLEDLDVWTAAGVFLGRVHAIMETGANDVLVVRGCEGSLDRQERLIPWVPEQVILDVDPEVGRITVDWDPDF